MRTLPQSIHDPAADTRRQESRLNRALKMLEEEPQRRMAVVTGQESTPEYFIMTIAIRGLAAFEVTVPREKYDAWNLLQVIEKHQGTVG